MSDTAPSRPFKFGWQYSLPDHRDLRLDAPPMGINIPPAIDLRPKMPPVYDQGMIGSCTANATDALVQFLLHPGGDTPWFSGSRMMIYYNARSMEGTIGSDAGAQLRDAIKSVARWGVCAETAWPYDDTPADDMGSFPPGCPAVTKPPQAAYDGAAAARAITYWSVLQDAWHLRYRLSQGFPIAFGFSVYSSFFAPDGNPLATIPMPTANDAMEGGHAVCLVGYDDATKLFTVRNSWGSAVQDHGMFYMPYDYVTNPQLASDFWTIRKVAP